MTDGENNSQGKNSAPLTAADGAQALGVKVYTIGVGTRGERAYDCRQDLFTGHQVHRDPTGGCG